MLQIQLLPAYHGDCLLVRFADETGALRTILIDGGIAKTWYQRLKPRLAELPAPDLLMVTHIDIDHIGGILEMLGDPEAKKDQIGRFWFNSGPMIARHFGEAAPGRALDLPDTAEEVGYRHGMTLEGLLEATGCWHSRPVLAGDVHQIGPATLRVLSPERRALEKLHQGWETELERQESEAVRMDGTDAGLPVATLAAQPLGRDGSVANGSSIACLLAYGDQQVLLAGDAHAPVLTRSLEALGYAPDHKLKLAAFKLSHHGSKANLSHKLLALLDCTDFLISTDGSRYGLPHKRTLAHILTHPDRDPTRTIRFYFNYDNSRLRGLFSAEEVDTYRIQCIFPDAAETGALLTFS